MADPTQFIRPRTAPNARRGVIRTLCVLLSMALLTGPTHAQLTFMHTMDDDDAHHRAAIEALGRLNLRLRARGKHEVCAQIRETVFAYYAFEITLLDRLRQSHVALTTIPHDGAIRRLRVLHDDLAHRPGQRDVEIARAIADLEAQLAVQDAADGDP